ncbi:hypothetical protein ABG067_008204, partial [Albugo candida]
FDDLLNAGPEKNGKDLFTCFIQTDGYGCSVQFARRKREEHELSAAPTLILEDFNRAEGEENFIPTTIDPGRKQIFTAAIGHNSNTHQTRRVSDVERRTYTGSRRRQNYVDKLKIQKGIKDIETNIPTAKKTNLETYEAHITYLLEHLPALLQFYSHKSAPFAFYNYQGRQRANAEVANIVLNGGKKYNPQKRKHTKKNRRERRKRRKSKEIGLLEDEKNLKKVEVEKKKEKGKQKQDTSKEDKA